MTDTSFAKNDADGFWTKVRAALSALRPENRDRPPAYGQAAIARSIGMKRKLGARLDEELVGGWRHAAARNVSMSLLVIEIDHFKDYFTAYGRIEADHTLLAVMRTIAELLPRAGDTCLRLGPSGFVLVLPDLPALMARATAQKIVEAVRQLSLPHKESHAGIVTVSIGMAVTNPHGNYDRKFFEAGAAALKKAQRRGIGRIEGVDLRPALERRRKAA
jgi:diguanylate cyclase (GGDEF)-like protein